MFKRILLFIVLLLVSMATIASAESNPNTPSGMRITHAQFSTLDQSAYVDAFVYDSFIWITLPDAELRSSIEGTVQSYTVGETDEIFSADIESSDSDSAQFYWVQLSAPVKNIWIDTLSDNGAELFDYLHPFTYLVWATPSIIQQIETEPFVHRTALYQPTITDDAPLYEAFFHTDVAASFETTTTDGWQIATVTAEQIAQTNLLAHNGLYTVQPLRQQLLELRDEYSNQIVLGWEGSQLYTPDYANWLAENGRGGSGLIAAVVDAVADPTHPSLVGQFAPCTGVSCANDASVVLSHATHVASVIVGNGLANDIDADGFNTTLGIAPDAKVINFPIQSTISGIEEIWQDAIRNQAVVSNNSWGFSFAGAPYEKYAQAIDRLIRDGDAETPENQPLISVVAIANGNSVPSSLGSPETAKNIISVGSTNARSADGTIAKIEHELAFTTGFGPSKDGRILPNLVAPGCEIYGGSINGKAAETLCGTSHAAPHVSGAILLFIEQYQRDLGTAEIPSPALTKAALIASARSLVGKTDGKGVELGHPPDNKQGWGELNITELVSPSLPTIYTDQVTKFTATGQSVEQTIYPVDESKPMKVVLVWSDAPGQILDQNSPALVNDLDLLISTNGMTHTGNQLGADGLSKQSTIRDNLNNMEVATFYAPKEDGVTLRIEASHIIGDGIPNNQQMTDQDFALVCVNCVAGELSIPPTYITGSAFQIQQTNPPLFGIALIGFIGIGGLTTFFFFRKKQAD